MGTGWLDQERRRKEIEATGERFEPMPVSARSDAVLALDQGTTGSSAIVVERHGGDPGKRRSRNSASYPASAHVEHDPDEIFATTVAVGRDALGRAGIAAKDPRRSHQQPARTTVCGNADRPSIHPAVVWQAASAAICERLRAEGHEMLVRERTGLVIDAYFSGTKIR